MPFGGNKLPGIKSQYHIEQSMQNRHAKQHGDAGHRHGKSSKRKYLHPIHKPECCQHQTDIPHQILHRPKGKHPVRPFRRTDTEDHKTQN